MEHLISELDSNLVPWTYLRAVLIVMIGIFTSNALYFPLEYKGSNLFPSEAGKNDVKGSGRGEFCS